MATSSPTLKFMPANLSQSQTDQTDLDQDFQRSQIAILNAAKGVPRAELVNANPKDQWAGYTFQPASSGSAGQGAQPGQFIPAGDQEPSITRHTPSTYAGLTVQKALKTIWAEGLSVNSDEMVKVHSDALARAQNFQADQAKAAEAKNLELQARAKAAQRGPGGELSLLETEEAERKGQETAAELQKRAQLIQRGPKGEASIYEQEKAQEAAVALSKEQQEQGPVASQEAAQLSKDYGRPVFIKAMPETQGEHLAQIETAYQRLNQLQALHKNMVQDTIGAGGWWKKKLGLLQLTSRYAQDFKAYQDESITPLSMAIMGDKAASATKETQVQLLKGAIANDEDNLPQAAHKIYMMKNTLMERLQAMKRQNLGTIATGQITSLYDELNKDFSSKETQANNAFAPINQQPDVQLGNSQEGRQQIANTILVPTPSPSPTPGQPAPTPQQQAQPTPTPQGAAVQQAFQYGGGSTVGTPQSAQDFPSAYNQPGS